MGYGLLANPDTFSLEMQVEWTFSGNSLIWVVLLLMNKQSAWIYFVTPNMFSLDFV